MKQGQSVVAQQIFPSKLLKKNRKKFLKFFYYKTFCSKTFVKELSKSILSMILENTFLPLLKKGIIFATFMTSSKFWLKRLQILSKNTRIEISVLSFKLSWPKDPLLFRQKYCSLNILQRCLSKNFWFFALSIKILALFCDLMREFATFNWSKLFINSSPSKQ